MIEPLPSGTKARDFFDESTARVNLAHGAVRSSKTVAANLRWIEAVLSAPSEYNVLMVGKTLGSLERNVLHAFNQVPGLQLQYKRSLKKAWLFGREIWLEGATDESAYQKIAGETLGLIYIDEGSLVPESFFNMALSRLSEPGAQLFLTT
ncbi:MAG: hypothetical protein J5I35_07560, partial [Methanothrix harundinacea]|nr:hypothetical protein [Methanothrix harundinacea]